MEGGKEGEGGREGGREGGGEWREEKVRQRGCNHFPSFTDLHVSV